MADSDFLNEFVVEAREHLENGEACLLRLIGDPTDHEAVQACFRTVHTLKGLAGFLSLERVQAVAHAAEQVLDRLRTEPTPCTPAQGDALLLTITRLRELVDGLESGAPPPEDDRELIALLEATNHASGRTAPEKDPYQPSPGASQRQEATSRRFRNQGPQAAPRTPVIVAAPSTPVMTAAPVVTAPSDAAQGMSIDTILGELIGMAADDLMGITRVLMDLDGLAGAWPQGARTLLMAMKGLGDRMLEGKLGAEGLAQILAHAERLPAAVAGEG
ncbi:MAG: Hpt domain-containing protein, partial [Planctomycetes bacterium]|nr:Hpt domain-containing protein [Planctomycetota bacterium]